MNEKTLYSNIPIMDPVDPSLSSDQCDSESELYHQDVFRSARQSLWSRRVRTALHTLVLVVAVIGGLLSLVTLASSPPVLGNLCQSTPSIPVAHEHSSHSAVPQQPDHQENVPHHHEHGHVSLDSVAATLDISSLPKSPFKRPIRPAPPAEMCGSTPAEAKAAGCVFEMSNFAWLPPDCADNDLNEDWSYGPLSEDLTFWDKPHGRGQPVAFDQVVQGETPLVWVTMRQHRRHCLFMWAKYQRAAMHSRPLDNWTASIRHTEHCIDIMQDESYSNDAINSYLSLKYPSCDYIL